MVHVRAWLDRLHQRKGMPQPEALAREESLMKVRLLSLVAGLLLAVGGLVTVDAQPASAHNQDNYTTFYCNKHKTNSLHTVTHSVYYYLDPQVAGIYCREQFFSVQRQYWVHVNLPLNSNSSWEPWDKQECKPTGPFPCDEP